MNGCQRCKAIQTKDRGKKKEREKKGDETERERETDISTDMAYFTLARGHILFD